MDMHEFKIIARQQMNESELADVQKLESVCSRHEGLTLKLNWSMLFERQTAETNDFLCYGTDGQLIGYLGMYYFGGPKAEINGMVHPSYRRSGIFSKLLKQATDECSHRGVKSLLFICERKSASGMAFIKTKEAVYDHSENKMELPESMKPIETTSSITLRRAEAADIGMVTKLSALCFELSDEEAEAYCSEKNQLAAAELFVVEFNDTRIGMIKLEKEKDDIFIYGFGIEPEYRGKGYGRAALGRAVNIALAYKPSRVALEVDCINDTALNLYKSCGFQTIATYDYYRLPI